MASTFANVVCLDARSIGPLDDELGAITGVEDCRAKLQSTM